MIWKVQQKRGKDTFLAYVMGAKAAHALASLWIDLYAGEYGSVLYQPTRKKGNTRVLSYWECSAPLSDGDPAKSCTVKV